MSTKVIKNKPSISIERRNTPTDIKRVSTILSSESRRKGSFLDKPTPLDFDTFIPWVCLEWQVPEPVVVIRMTQEKYSRSDRRGSSSRAKSVRSTKLKEDEDSISKKDYTSATNTIVTKSSTVENIISITALYDLRGNLVEIYLNASASIIHRKIIQAISLCVPFHSSLTKLTIRKGQLNHILLHEIGKLLPHSNLTDVCLDDTYIPEGNYYVLLAQASNMKYLSLNRCRVNDEVCKEIASRIDYEQPAEKSLLMLDLSSNEITDLGAKYFGKVLRQNRHLLYLNLAGNRIGDAGFEYILNHLREFPLTAEEIRAMKLRKMEYIQRKIEVYEHCWLQTAHIIQKSEVFSLHSDLRSTTSARQAKSKKSKKHLPHVDEELSRQERLDIVENMTLDIIGKLNDPLGEDSVIRRNNNYYSTGNLKLCSLNVAYNNIEYPSIVRTLEVLRYQCHLDKKSSETGLMRVVLEGNYLPNKCSELENINMYLKKALNSVNQTCQTKKRASFEKVKHKF